MIDQGYAPPQGRKDDPRAVAQVEELQAEEDARQDKAALALEVADEVAEAALGEKRVEQAARKQKELEARQIRKKKAPRTY